MDGPQQGNRQCQRKGALAPAVAHRRQEECPPHDAQQQQGAENVNGQIRRMVAPYAAAADGVIDRQREVQQRSARDGFAVVGRAERRPDGPEAADSGILHDPRLVVEDERAGETVVVGCNCRQYNDCRRQQGRSAGPFRLVARVRRLFHGQFAPRFKARA